MIPEAKTRADAIIILDTLRDTWLSLDEIYTGRFTDEEINNYDYKAVNAIWQPINEEHFNMFGREPVRYSFCDKEAYEKCSEIMSDLINEYEMGEISKREYFDKDKNPFGKSTPSGPDGRGDD